MSIPTPADAASTSASSPSFSWLPDAIKDVDVPVPLVGAAFFVLFIVYLTWYNLEATEASARKETVRETLATASDNFQRAKDMKEKCVADIAAARIRVSSSMGDYKVVAQKQLEEQIKKAEETRIIDTEAAKARLIVDRIAAIKAAEPQIMKKKDAFVKATLAEIGM